MAPDVVRVWELEVRRNIEIKILVRIVVVFCVAGLLAFDVP